MTTPKKVILCIDDERIVLTSLKAQLKRGLGPEYVIETAESCDDALEIIDEVEREGAELPLIITDQIMPGCNGDDLLIIIHKRLPRSLSIMLTGHADADAVGRALNLAGLYRYIPKPWDEMDLILTVSEAIRSYNQNKTIREQNAELERLVKQLQDYNETLEEKVRERTLECEVRSNEILSQRDTLEEMNAVKDKLFAIIGHDLKNSLTALISISNVLAKCHEEMNEEDRKESIVKIEHSTREMYNLLEHLLEWTRIQNGKVQFSPDLFDLGNLARETISIMRTPSEKKNIRINQAIPSETLVHGDRNMIGTILRNLISNAIKFSPSGGVVEIRGELISHNGAGTMYQVVVEDTGIGMDTNRLSTLFRIGQSASSPGTDNEKGTGLGLLICKDLVEINGGSIHAVSAPGKGSRFMFTIPANRQSLN